MTPRDALFGSFLRKQRKRTGKYMHDIAEVSGLSIVQVSDIERGKLTGREYVQRYVDAIATGKEANVMMALFETRKELEV